MSRLALTLKNAWIALVFYIAYIFIQFYSRNIFLDRLGDDFMGVVGTLKSILQFLNLSELGIGAAVGFSLYKPIYDKNRDKINEIIGYLGFLYQRIGIFVFSAAMLLLLFFPNIFKNTEVNLWIIIFLFVALLTSNLLSYLFAYHVFLLQADQKGYKNVTINQSIFIARLLLQCVALIVFDSLIFWISLELIMPFIYIYLIRKRIRKTYPWLIFNFKATKEIRNRNKALLKKIKELSFHKLGNFVSNGTDNIVIFSFINPATVAFVVNYQLIMNNINTLVNQFFQGTNSSVGNLVAENNMTNTMKVFWEMMALRFFFAGSASILMFIGFDDLITLWLGSKYIMSQNVLIALIIIFYILQIRTPVNTFVQAYGLYSDIWAPLVQSLINLAISIILVIKFGVIGVFIGTIVSQTAIVLLWRPFYLFRSGFQISIIKYWIGFIQHIIYFTIAIGLFYLIESNINLYNNVENLFYLLIKLTVHGIIFTIIYIAIMLLLSKGFKNLATRFKTLIKSKFLKSKME